MLASRLWIPAVVTSLTLGCALEPPVATPEDARALARARERGRDADTEQATVAQERSAYVAEIERKQAELAELDAEFQASLADHRRRADEHESYVAAIASAEAFASACDDSLGPLNALTAGSAIAASSSAYTSEPSRDAALAAMEECRTKLLEQARKLAKQVVADMREEFATEVEDSFDANNPYSRGDLSAKVSGTTLAVKMRGNFEGRARHSQDQVDLWCESGEGLFSKITLKNGHGSFSCTPLESPSQFLAALLDDTGGTASREVTGALATPSDPGPEPVRPPGLQSRRDKLVGEIARLEAANQALDARARDALVAADQARQSRAAVERRQAARVDAWGEQAQQRASRTVVAGVVLTSLGAIGLIATTGAQTQPGLTGAKDFLPIGVGISVPVLVTGVALIVGGGVRKARIRDALVCARTHTC